MMDSTDNSALDILLTTSNYPYRGHPNVGTFVSALAETWARHGERVDVIAPIPVWTSRTKEFSWRHSDSSGRLKPNVVRPSFLSFSNRKFGPISTQNWTARSFRHATRRAASRLGRRPDVVYSHFLFPAGLAGSELARQFTCPSVVALGESGFELAEAALGRDGISEVIRGFDGILSVSVENAQIISERYGADPSRIRVVPNAVDTDRFRPHDRREARIHLGLPEDITILSFTGYFNNRKGPLRVLEAMERIPGLHGVFLGDGAAMPAGERVLHAGRVEHEEVALWLAASDFFVLPTLAEGSPNAVLEAMACGLPVVSSNIPSLLETVDEDSALLVDPEDIDAITDALAALSHNIPLRNSMGAAALRRGRRTNLNARADEIRTWLHEIVSRYRGVPR